MRQRMLETDGLSEVEIAEELGVSRQAVHQVLRAGIRKIWRMQVADERLRKAEAKARAEGVEGGVSLAGVPGDSRSPVPSGKVRTPRGKKEMDHYKARDRDH